MNTALRAFPTWLARTSLVTQIAIGLACGIALALVAPDAARATAPLGANFVGILAWAVGLGLALRHASAGTRTMLTDLSEAVSSSTDVLLTAAGCPGQYHLP